jgi:hypothetical protein
MTAAYPFQQLFGVDFSGAKLAGENTWVARLVPAPRKSNPDRLRLIAVERLTHLAGTAERGPVLSTLVSLVRSSDAALWGFDFPFGLPVEVMPARATWFDQLDWVRGWGDDAYALGLECLRRAKAAGLGMHVRRTSDCEARAPFDPYHYRVIYQTFFGMRDVLARLAFTRETAVLPFQYRRLPTARRVVVESCPSSLLKKLGLPHQNYKQPAGGPLTRKRLKTRRVLLGWLSSRVVLGPAHRRVMMRNGGGDALDAVLAGVGAALGWREADHRAIARHPRYRREGRMFV